MKNRYLYQGWAGNTYSHKCNSQNSPSKPAYVWTGHVDVEGLKAIGWTDEDIECYQKNGVSWNEECDELYIVPEENIALYHTLTAENISEYKDKIVYLPKIDTSHMTNMDGMFKSFKNLLAIPLLDTSNVTSMREMFSECEKLIHIPLLDTKNVTDMYYMFSGCDLETIPLLDTGKVTTMQGMFSGASLLHTLPKLNTSNVTNMSSMFIGSHIETLPSLDTKKVTDMSFWLSYNSSITLIQQIDMSSVTSAGDMFGNCSNLQHIKIKGLRTSLKLWSTSAHKRIIVIYD